MVKDLAWPIRAGAPLLALLLVAPFAGAAPLSAAPQSMEWDSPPAVPDPRQLPSGSPSDDPLEAPWLPCVRYAISDANGSVTRDQFPRHNVCNSTSIEFTWKVAPFRGQGDLWLNLSKEDLARLAEDATLKIKASDVVLVETGPMALVDRLVAGLVGEAERSRPDAPAGEPRAPERVVLHVRFSVTWLAPDCRDAQGEFEAEANDARWRATPARSFFRDLCGLAGDPGATPAIPRLVADALDAARDAAPPTQPLRVLATIARLAQGARLLAGPGSAPTVDAPAPEAEVSEQESGAIEGEALLLASPRDGGVSAKEEVGMTAVLVEARQAARLGAHVGGSSRQGAGDAGSALAGDGGGDAARPHAPLDPAAAARQSRDPDASRREPSPVAPPAAVFAARVAPGRVSPVVLHPPAALAGIALATGLLALVGFALYQRIARSQALDHPARAALYAACVAQGPATASQLARASGMTRRKAEHHLWYMARLGLIREARSPDGPRRFALSAAPRAPPQACLDERLLASVRDSPGLTTALAARRLGLTAARADRRLKGLVLRGRLESEMRDGQRRFFLPSRG